MSCRNWQTFFYVASFLVHPFEIKMEEKNIKNKKQNKMRAFVIPIQTFKISDFKICAWGAVSLGG